MFEIGDKIVYPMYGAGLVTGIEIKEIAGVEESFYVMEMPIGSLTIMIGVRNAEEMGVRKVKSREEMEKIMNQVSDEISSMPDNWNQRFNEHTEKIKTGSFYEVSEVFRNLKARENEKGLSTAEKKMLSNVKQILGSEVVLSLGVLEKEAEIYLDNWIVPNEYEER